MAKLDRIPATYDQIFKFKIPKCSEPKCERSDLLYQQMYQHEMVCTEDISKALDPIKLDYLPYIHSSGDKISLIDSDQLRRFHTSPVPIKETFTTNIKLGAGFKVCLLRHTNHIFIVGGEGTENKTHIFNPDTNLIEETSWDLKYSRTHHSLCSTDNVIVCTGSKIESAGNKVEVFKYV